jgi:hypothetical protein
MRDDVLVNLLQLCVRPERDKRATNDGQDRLYRMPFRNVALQIDHQYDRQD